MSWNLKKKFCHILKVFNAIYGRGYHDGQIFFGGIWSGLFFGASGILGIITSYKPSNCRYVCIFTSHLFCITLEIGAFGHNLVSTTIVSLFYRVISMFVFSILTLLLAIGMIAKGTTVIVAESNYGHFDNFGKIC